MLVYGWIIIGVLVLVLIFAIWYISTANTFIRLKNNIEESFATMDVYMKQRYDLIPNLVNTVKGVMKHEKETLSEIVALRNSGVDVSSREDKMNADNKITGALSRLFALAEAYPDLKANTNFLDLQNTMKEIETSIANTRKYYNACVKEYNVKLQVFPSSIVARRKKYQKEPMFEISKEERKNVKVEF